MKASQDIGGQTLEFKFDFDLFGVGDDEGKTTFRLQNFYAKWGPILAGQCTQFIKAMAQQAHARFEAAVLQF